MIPIKNIYYMFSYAFQCLNAKGFKRVATEKFSNAADLCAELLIRGINYQLKRGLGKEYISVADSISSVKGKIDVSESIKKLSFLNKQMVCLYDEFSENSYMNQIIKSTLYLLLKGDISKIRAKEIRRLLVFFSAVDLIDLSCVNWRFRYNRNNHTYRILISVCFLVSNGLLLTTEDGNAKLLDYFDEQAMSKLYEKFILGYFKKEHPELKTNASFIPWQLDDGYDFMLPVMKSDISLSAGNKTLIIDAKYYSNNMQSFYGSHTLHSGNLYQIFTYVKNKEAELNGQSCLPRDLKGNYGESSYNQIGRSYKVSGMLLYAKTDAVIQPDAIYQMSGNQISVKTLDLDCDFVDIRAQLDYIAEVHFS